ncbi:DMT family transporter [Gloeocapsopsis dulcis]|uniref:EamA family transporter n=1 Tax=Gloeocapsopsis dulcis AAB1 = 1H9 TaxID=1433147 RepID=A0A6N8FQT5_9CHRO|nr:DMT family transporter [Gloeocapsopsis dulcis]MUL35530.1 EamA family transporter [Gloeocapsopsis dulcis AAB1 = 1H9]WNN87572.1 DMT family transporter [Gloeocapsopsis dulcis]
MQIWQVPKPWQIGLVLIIGVFGISTAAIFVRLAFAAVPGVPSVGFSLVLSATRLTISAILLLPAWRHLRSSPPSRTSVYYALVAGVCLALHFATWITSLAFTSIAAASTLVSSTPIWVALLSWLWLREKLSLITLIGVGVALAGGIVIALGSSGVDVASRPLLGTFLALFGAWMYGLYLLLGRKAQQEGLGLGSYITIAYTTGAFILLPLPGLFSASYTGYPLIVYVYILLIAIFSQMIGHTSLNWGMRWLSPTFVTLAALFEPVGASFLAYFLLDELPGRLTLLGAAILLVGVACAIVGSQHE